MSDFDHDGEAYAREEAWGLIDDCEQRALNPGDLDPLRSYVRSLEARLHQTGPLHRTVKGAHSVKREETT